MRPEDTPVRTRCAIYTRKSTEEGLDSDFNTLDAQRESAEAYITSQRHQGWEIVAARYDDGGFTGANMERPALKRLIADIEAGFVDAVVVYKVDRLSRSLLDFSKLLEFLDEHKVAFVSVTQQFSTATSAGRLMLNVLLSFAQFERETIAERTRDKMRAARRKGKWVGGTQMLGYDIAPEGGRLVVNETEAEQVRAFFDLYLTHRTLGAVSDELRRRGWTNKTWVTKKGTLHQGKPFTKSTVSALLKNPVYIGRVLHRGQVYDGEHDAIVEQETWDQVQALLAYNAGNSGKRTRNKHGALLRGLLYCAACEAGIVHTTSKKNGGKTYRYYVCRSAQEHGWNTCPGPSLPATEIEDFVVDQIRAIGKDRDLIDGTVDAAAQQVAAELRDKDTERRSLEADLTRLQAEDGPEERIQQIEQRLSFLASEREHLLRANVDRAEVSAVLGLFDPVWGSLFPKERARVIRLLVEQVRYDGAAGTVAITFRPTGIRSLADELRDTGEPRATRRAS